MGMFSNSLIQGLINPSFGDSLSQVGMLAGSYDRRRREKQEEEAKKALVTQRMSALMQDESPQRIRQGATELFQTNPEASKMLMDRAAEMSAKMAQLTGAPENKARAEQNAMRGRQASIADAAEPKRTLSAALNLRNAVNNAPTAEQRNSANTRLQQLLLDPEVRKEYNAITQGEQTAAIQLENNERGRSSENRAQELHSAAVKKAEADASQAVRSSEKTTWLSTVPPAAWQTPEGQREIALTALKNGDGVMFQRVSELIEQGVAAERGVDMDTVNKSLNAANPNFKPSLEDRRNAEILMAQADMAAVGPAGLKALQERFVASFAPATASRALAEMNNLRGSTDLSNRIGNSISTLIEGRATLRTQAEYREIAKFMRDFANYEISKTIDAVEAGGGTSNIGVADTARRVYGVLEDNMFTEDPEDAALRQRAREIQQKIQAEKALGRSITE
jgi:hypothetical protein